MRKLILAGSVATLVITLANGSALAHKKHKHGYVDAPHTSVEVDRDVRVEAPYTRVEAGDRVAVDAPYTSVRVNKHNRRIRIRAPYVNLNIGY